MFGNNRGEITEESLLFIFIAETVKIQKLTDVALTT